MPAVVHSPIPNTNSNTNNNNSNVYSNNNEHPHYTRIRMLGSGAFGKVYLVVQNGTDDSFVIKQIELSDMTEQ